MNGLALCAGIGGLELGLKLALGDGYTTVGYCEREAFAASVLVARMEDQSLDCAPIWDDVATFPCDLYSGRVDIISGGYPCQPFSIAGNRLGTDDPRHLWPHIHRILFEIQPEICFFENVPGHLSLGFEAVHHDLEAMGYRIEAGLFRADEVGSPQRRERLFILGYSDSSRLAQREPRTESSAFSSSWPPSPESPSRGTWDGPEPAVRRGADGTAYRVDRLRALGNAVVPAVAARAFTTLSAAF